MVRRSTWVTLAVFVVLVGFAIYWIQFQPGEESITETMPVPEAPWNISISDIESVEVSDLNKGMKIKLLRSSVGEWVSSAPENGLVDSELVENSVRWLQSPRVNRILSTEGGLEQFGLETPVGVIRVTFLTGDEMVLYIGDVSPLGNQTYAIVPNTNEVLLIRNVDVNSVMDFVGLELLQSPSVEEPTPELAPELP